MDLQRWWWAGEEPVAGDWDMAGCEGSEGNSCELHIESHCHVCLIIVELNLSTMNSYQGRRTIGGSEANPGPNRV